MERFKAFCVKHFELLLVLSLLIIVFFITWIVPYKIFFLNFFFLPVLISGYYLKKEISVMSAFFSILLVILCAILFPKAYFLNDIDKIYIIMGITVWGSFLILCSYLIGILYQEKENRIFELKEAYIGILEIMSKYLETADKYTQGHSVRVSRISQDIAIAMGRPRREVENIKAAALLHDIGKTEISMDIVNKAAVLSESEQNIMNTHTEKGAEIISLVGSVLKEAVPIVLTHHKYYFETDKHFSKEMEPAVLGAAIIAVADAYDALVTDRPYRAGVPPWKAIEEIKQNAGHQFNPDVVHAFENVLKTDESYRLEKPAPDNV